MRPSNRLFAEFGEDLAILRPHLREVALRPGHVLWEPGDRIGQVYFPQNGMISKLSVFSDGTEIECALVGREGAVGAMAALGLRTAATRDVCHLRARAYVIETERLQEALLRSKIIHEAIDRYCGWKAVCAMRNGACNARHPIEQRLCRWLLTCADALDEREIRLSQDVLAKMVGAQRTSVNRILQHLQTEGLVKLGRSRLTIANAQGLRGRACECYAANKAMEAEVRPSGEAPDARVARRDALRRYRLSPC